MNLETRKTTKGWKVVREKLVKPIPANPINSHESLNSNSTSQKPSNTEITLPKANPVKGLIKGKARGWKVLRKRIERREFTEDLRLSNLQLNRMDEKSPTLRYSKYGIACYTLKLQSNTEKINQNATAQSTRGGTART